MRNKLKKATAIILSLSALAATFPVFAEYDESILTDNISEATEEIRETLKPAETIIPTQDPKSDNVWNIPEFAEKPEGLIEPSIAPESSSEQLDAPPDATDEPISDMVSIGGMQMFTLADTFSQGGASVVDSGTCGDNLTWTLKDNTLTISGTGDMYDYADPDEVPWTTKNSQLLGVYSIVIKDGVTSIGDYAFFDCRYVNHVTIPDSVKDIGYYSFGQMGGSYHAGDASGDKLYFTIELGNGVETIGDFAFSRNHFISDIKLGENVKHIGNSAFSGCICIDYMYIPQSVTTIGNHAFKTCTALSDIYIYNYENRISGSPWDAKATVHWLGEIKIESIPTQYTYGNAVTPEVVIYNVNSDNGTKTKLVKGVDYTVSYENNTTSGTGTANISYMDDYASYSGSATSATFNIVNYDPMSIAAIGTQYYTGGAVKPKITINYNDTVLGVSNTLVEGEDYMVSYSNNNAVGTGTVTVKYLGKHANYNGSATSASFTIKAFDPAKVPTGPINVSSVDFEIPDCTYYWGNPAWGGNSIKPVIRATYSYTVNGTRYSYPLTEDEDYTVTYENNESVGTALATIVGKGEFTGETSYYYTIYPMTLPSSANDLSYNPIANVTFPNGNKYTGKKFEGEKDLKLDYITLYGLDDYPKNLYNYFGDSYEGEADCYDASWPNDVVNAGVYSYSIIGNYNFTGTMKGRFTIEPRDISETSISVSECEYEGEFAYPVISITYNGMKLVNGKDYTVNINNNDAAGTGKATITGIGNYTGTVEKSFTIAACPMSAVSINSIENQRYTGSAISPDVTVTYNGKTLIKDTDYTVSYSNNTNIGTATVTITGKGNYTSTVTKTFTISQANISNAAISGIDSTYAYTGSAITPTPTVKVSGRTLTENTDYTVVYSNNTNCGTATVTITGRGNYTGTYTKTFTISRASISGAAISGISSIYTYTGSAITPAPTVKVSGRTLTENTDYTVVYSNNTNPGTATVTITGKGNYTSTCKKTFEIIKNDISDTEVSGIEDSYHYTKEEIRPEPKVTYNGKTLTKDTDYTVRYSNNVNLGTATVTITGMGIYIGTVTKIFEIEAINLSGTEVTFPDNITWNGAAVEPEPTVVLDGKTLTKGTDYTITYSNNVFTADDFPTKDTTHTAVATITGIGNYIGSLTKDFEVEGYKPNNRDSVDISLSNLVSATIDGTFVYNGTEHNPTPKLVYHFVNPTTNVAIDYDMVEGEDFKIVSYADNVNVGTAKIVVEGIGAFENTKPIFFDISPCELSATTIADIPSFEYCKKDICPDVEIKVGDTVMTNGVDYDLSYENNRNRGTATVTITGKGNMTGVTTTTFEITPRDGSKFVYIIWL